MRPRWLAIVASIPAFSGACGGEEAPTDVQTVPAQVPTADERTRNEESMARPQPVAEGKIPIEEVAKYPQPGTSVPGSIAFVPPADGSAVTYLWSDDASLTRELYVDDPEGGGRRVLFAPEDGATEENLSPEEKLQRERRRERGLGVTRYRWAADGDRLLIPLRGDIWVQDGVDGKPRKIVDTEGEPALDARLSRDGAFVSYVQDDELFVVPAAGGKPRQLTTGARGTGKTHGLAEYIAQEEMDRHAGAWWSFDGSWLAYTEVDETGIPTYRIEHQGADQPTHEDHGYPFAGGPNARVRLGVVPRGGGRTVWMDLSMEGEKADDLYLARVRPMPDGSLLAAVENRAQSRLDLRRHDPKTGRGTVLLTEQSDVWINLDHLLRPLEHGEGELAGAFVWGSERTGFRHLYLYAADGRLLRPLTEGAWMVDAVVGIDEDEGRVYFTGTRDGPTERHLYRVSLEGGAVEKLTEAPGMHGIVMDREEKNYVDVHSSLDAPPTITVHRASDGARLGSVEVPTDPRIAALGLRPPRLVTVTTRDGVELHGAIYRPAGDPPFPTIVSVYGGPHAQRVHNDWSMTADMRAQYLRDQGYLVFKLDNRGSARRGLAFEGAIRHDLGNIEVQDQVDGVRWLVREGLTDPARVGIYGWSYGGYMAAMALARAPETFSVAVAGAPVTHWDGYDTHYTERYMGTPASNPEGYEQSSVMAHVGDMKGDLMLVHGLVDENVHFRHTARLVNALIGARKHYELLLFPDERHMPRREEDRVYMETRIRDFFREHL